MSQASPQRSNIIGMGALGQALRPLIPEDAAVVFFCVKAFDLKSALLDQAGKWPMGVPFVTLSNGFLGDILSEVLPALGARPLRLGMTTMGAAFDSQGLLKVYQEGSQTCWGHWGEANGAPVSEAEAELCKKNNWQWMSDVRPMLRRKWIFNTTLNTLCGALRLANNGNLLNHKALANDVLHEAFQLSAELWPEVELNENENQLKDQLWRLVELTSKNENSLMRDVRLGRRTESAFLAGQAAGKKGYDRLKTYHAVLARLG